jgi:hypothetical protein
MRGQHALAIFAAVGDLEKKSFITQKPDEIFPPLKFWKKPETSTPIFPAGKDGATFNNLSKRSSANASQSTI